MRSITSDNHISASFHAVYHRHYAPSDLGARRIGVHDTACRAGVSSDVKGPPVRSKRSHGQGVLGNAIAG